MNVRVAVPLKWAVTAVVALSLGFPGIKPSQAASTINVPSVGNSTIQSAINHAVNGDTVLVADGTYHERINFNGKAITVNSVNGASVTTINGDTGGSVVTFNQSESNSSVLSGFTVKNGSGGIGGGISCQNSSSPTITNCTISSNTGDWGGGISCYGSSSSPTITNCTISSNTGGAGGGISCYDSSSPAITNCTIIGNTADSSGGGISCYGSSSPAITNCTISGNIASNYGGGVYCQNSSFPITNCTISGNTTGNYGGGIYCASSSPTITNCTIHSNTASSYGGGIYCWNSSSFPITNCTISGNTVGSDGGGIYCSSSSLTVLNSILWGDTAEGTTDEISLGGGSSLTITYSDIQGSYTGTGNISSNPKFIGGGDFHLQHGSPCIDAANSDSPVTSHDQDGNPRYDDPNTANTGTGANGSYYDMGAYERQTPSTTINVPGVGNSTIQSAIDHAADGDTVLVADGTYHERINFNGKIITVRSVNGASVTTINGGAGGSVVTFNHSESNSSVLSGFTITNGSGTHITSAAYNIGGGGIYCSFSSPTITNCNIRSNTAYRGGGIYCWDSSPAVTNCTINGNSAGTLGGGIYCGDSSPTINNCTIRSNSANEGGGIYCDNSSPVITNCTISGNTGCHLGGGIRCQNSSSPTITNCIINGNTASCGKGVGGGISCENSSSPTIINCTISRNKAYYGGGIASDNNFPVVNSILWGDDDNSGPNEIYASISITYSDIQGGYAGTGNINSNPKFVGGGDFHLQRGSPCIDTGTNSGAPATDKEGHTRPQGLRSDMGAYEFDLTPPAVPVVSSLTHPNQAAWYNSNAPAFNWTVSSDESGITGYGYILNQTANTVPDTVSEGTAATKNYTGKPSGVWYFHVRARDGAGNWGPAAHYTVRIDTVAPAVLAVSSSTHPLPTAWYDNHNPVFNWTMPADLTGVTGYSYILDQIRTTIPNTAVTSSATTVGYSNIASGTWYFHVRATDGAGNWGATRTCVINIGTIIPAAPAVSSSTHPNQGLTYSNNSPEFTWTADSDNSGIAGYSYILDQNPATTPDNISKGTATTKSYTGKANGNWYFHIRAKDGAGKWSATTHYSIHIDSSLP